MVGPAALPFPSPTVFSLIYGLRRYRPRAGSAPLGLRFAEDGVGLAKHPLANHERCRIQIWCGKVGDPLKGPSNRGMVAPSQGERGEIEFQV